MCDDEVACVTAGATMVQTVLAEADELACPCLVACVSPEAELRARLPLMLAQLSPGARAVLREHNAHVTDLVAGLHSALRAS